MNRILPPSVIENRARRREGNLVAEQMGEQADGRHRGRWRRDCSTVVNQLSNRHNGTHKGCCVSVCVCVSWWT